jgi:hypothetical protein
MKDGQEFKRHRHLAKIENEAKERSQSEEIISLAVGLQSILMLNEDYSRTSDNLLFRQHRSAHDILHVRLLPQVSPQVLQQVNPEHVTSQVRRHVSAHVLQQVFAQVTTQVLGQVSTQVLGQVGTQVLGQVGMQVCRHVSAHVLMQVLPRVGLCPKTS